MALTLKVKGFNDGESIPKRYTCDGEDLSPALEWANEPRGVESFALIMDDPDAPAGTRTHWLLWDIPAPVHSLSEGFTPRTVGESGKNHFRRPPSPAPFPPHVHTVHPS